MPIPRDIYLKLPRSVQEILAKARAEKARQIQANAHILSSDLEPDISPSAEQGETQLEQVPSDSNGDSDNFGLLAHMMNQLPSVKMTSIVS